MKFSNVNCFKFKFEYFNSFYGNDTSDTLGALSKVSAKVLYKKKSFLFSVLMLKVNFGGKTAETSLEILKKKVVLEFFFIIFVTRFSTFFVKNKLLFCG